MVTKQIAWTTGSGNITLTYEGQGNGSINVQSDANDIGSTRSQTIIIETTAGSPVIIKNLTVSQEACPFPVGDVRNFAYTGNVQSVVLPAGTYKFQCWGAQGGTCSSGYSGGKGGYSEGVLTLTSPTTVYIFVGGQGSSSGNGGWNGGGGGSGSSSYSSGDESGSSTFGCGGGATDIALVTSSMSYSSYRNNRSAASLLSRMIVAGGGSGGAYGYKSYTYDVDNTTTLSSGTITCTDGPHTANSVTFYQGTVSLGTLYQGHRYVFSCSGSNIYEYYMAANNGWYNLGSDTGVLSEDKTRVLAVARITTKNQSVSYSVSDTYTTQETGTSSDYKAGYVGGGTNGGGYSSSYYGKQNGAGSNGSFGLGANQTVTNYRYGAGCGGGGWYGGGNSYSDSGLSTIRYSGGGSGFVNTAANAQYRPSGYTGLQLDSGTTYAGNTSFPNTAGTGNETGHAGNGYAKITRIAAYSVTLRFKDEEDSPVTGASVTVSNSENTYSLTTDSNGEATATMQNGTYNLSCSGYSLTPSQITVSSNATIDIVAAAPSIMDFSYTGAVQTDTLAPGTYRLEVWGAQGGTNSSYIGGKGGYSVGELTLAEATQVYVLVGGAGSSSSTTAGFNGGGAGVSSGKGGGGGSDIRLGSNSLYARVIVAGGGGGAGVGSASANPAGCGGGTYGGDGYYNNTTGSYPTGSNRSGGSASQTSGGISWSSIKSTRGTFGQGGNAYNYSCGGGGGGWYGGGGAYDNDSDADGRWGGGGSGYVYNSSTASSYPSGCLLNSSHYLSNSQTIAGNASMPSTSGSTETGHSGNGYVRITKI